MGFLTIALLSVCGVEWSWLKNTTYNRTAFYVFWGLANGPFAISVIIFKNALVLHDLPNLASTFIHLTPISLAWTFRWRANEVMKAYPGVFNLPNPDLALSESFLDIFLPPMAFYAIWWVFYTFVYMFFIGRFIGNPWSKYDTLYIWTMQTDKTQAKFCGWDASTPETRQRMCPIIKYMFIHASLFVTTIAFSYVMWFNFWFHTFVCVCLFLSCTYHGSVRYFKMMTTYYEKSL